MMFVIVGVPGAGKTTVINSFLEKHRDWKVFNYGTLMFEEAKKFGINDRDELRKSDISIQKEIQLKVVEFLEKIEEKEVILDTHAAIKTPKGYLPGLPLETLKRIKIDGIVLVTAEVEEILERRKRDESRKRDIEERRELEEHIEINKAMCSTYSIISQAPFYILYNREGMLDKTVEELEKVLI